MCLWENHENNIVSTARRLMHILCVCVCVCSHMAPLKARVYGHSRMCECAERSVAIVTFSSLLFSAEVWGDAVEAGDVIPQLRTSLVQTEKVSCKTEVDNTQIRLQHGNKKWHLDIDKCVSVNPHWLKCSQKNMN